LVEIVAGLTPGDRIVSAGTNKVSQGRPLEIVEAAASQGDS